jgi:hypothetical protein
VAAAQGGVPAVGRRVRRRKIERYGLTRTIDPRHFFPTIESAVAAFRRETGARWAAAEPTQARLS